MDYKLDAAPGQVLQNALSHTCHGSLTGRTVCFRPYPLEEQDGKTAAA